MSSQSLDEVWQVLVASDASKVRRGKKLRRTQIAVKYGHFNDSEPLISAA